MERCQAPKTRRRKKPYLCDNVGLGRAFRKHYVQGLRRLLRQGKLRIGGSVDFLNDVAQREEWLSKLEQTDWNVFVQGPIKNRTIPTVLALSPWAICAASINRRQNLVPSITKRGFQGSLAESKTSTASERPGSLAF